MDFVSIDFETANNNNNSACSIGLVCVKGLKIIDTYYYLIQPPTLEFGKKNIEIHGITPEDVKDKPKFPEIWEEIKDLFEDNIIIAHNAQFDMSVLKSLQLEYDLDIPDFKYICSIPISTKACKGIGNSLQKRAEYLGIDMGEHHNALDDAITCANIVINTINKKKRKSFQSFLNTYTSLPIRNFSELKHQAYMRKRNKFESVNISEITPDVEELNYSHAFYGKNIVFTGELSELSRKDAMQIVVNLGGVLKSGVSRTTDYLIVGTQDKSIVAGEGGLSRKEEKAYELLANGFDIKITTEDEFYDLISEKSF